MTDTLDLPVEPASTGLDALQALRRTRQLHRLGNLDWFEAAYRAYLLGIFGGGGVLWISSSIKDEAVSSDVAADVLRHGPAVLGLFVALAFLAGIRGGAQGGPVALEGADVAHVMLAPIDRRRALMRPAVQRLRSALFMGVAFGAIVGQLAARRLPGSLVAWAAAGALYGATLMAVWVGAALLAHTLRVPRWLATLLGLGALAWQFAAVAWHVPGPFTSFGSLALWGWRQQTTDLVAVALTLIGVVVGFVLLGRLSLDALARRSALVAQLRFAVTMQDLRTVILLRRQLNQEHARRRPYVRLPVAKSGSGFTATVWRRGWHGLLRFPVSRLLRMAAIAGAMGVLQASVVRGTTPAFLGTALLGFVLGLEVMEPLSQEVDQADRADALPVERGELMARHLAAPIVALLPFALIAGVAAVITLGGNSDAIVPVAVIAIPTVIGAAMGGVVSIVRDAPNPASNSQQAFMPPEMAGFTTAIRLAWPIVVSTITTVTVLLPRAAWRGGESATGAAIRSAVGVALVIAFIIYWVKVRDRVHQRIRAFMDEGRSYTAQQRSSA
ncbi:MAG: hypothetical protein HY828_08255 [Actinobacteria bacterium]|nr:hypothetical protein [Actinomycetota bacterium]